MRSGFIEPFSLGWSETLSEVRHDVYHLPKYVELSATQLEGGEPRAFFAEEHGQWLLIPLVIRPVEIPHGQRRLTMFDATSPYGYPGPLLHQTSAGDAEEFLGRAFDAFVQALQERSIIAAFVRLHPILTLPLAPLERVGRLIPHGDTISMDLTLPAEHLWSQMRLNHRRNITKAAHLGHRARIDESWQSFGTFVELYYQTMRRLNAHEYYFFSPSYLIDLKSCLGEHLHLCAVEVGDRVSAAGLFTETCGIVQYHLSGTADDFVTAHPLKTMLNFVGGWAQERGNQVLHLGGGLGGQRDSLYHYKAGFSRSRHPFFTWRVVAEEATYRRLVERWEEDFGSQADPVEGYFPSYRKRGGDRPAPPKAGEFLAGEAGILGPMTVDQDATDGG